MTARSEAARQPPRLHRHSMVPDIRRATTACTLALMRRRALVAAMATLALLLAACSDGGTTGASPGEAAAARTDAAPSEPAADAPLPPVFVQHGVAGSVEVDAGEPIVVVRGIDAIMVELGSEDASTLSIEDFHTEWDASDADAAQPQAAFVFGDPDHEPALVSLSEPSWNPTTRTVTYGIGVPADRDPRLDGIAPTGATLPDQFDLVTLYVAWPGTDTVPAPTTTTTIAATTTTTTTTISATLPPVATTSPAPTPNPTSPDPTPTSPPTNPPPAGPALIRASPEVVQLPSAGGSATFILQNAGSGAGSWTVRSIASQGISASPSSGILLPSGATTVTVSYNGHGPAEDFLDELKIVTSSGTIIIRIIVDG